eukprot:gene1016-1288_t
MNAAQFKASLEAKGIEIKKSNGRMQCIGIKFDQEKMENYLCKRENGIDVDIAEDPEVSESINDKEDDQKEYDSESDSDINTLKESEDGKPNSFIYPNETRIDGPTVSKKFVEMLYNLKSKGIEESKSPLNSLWGYIASDNENSTLKLVHSQEPFETPFARIQPFIVSHARKIMFNLLKDHIDNIVWIHTDGFISNKMINLKKEL